MNHDDTIVAIATAMMPSGIGIIRVSGDESLKIISSIFVDKNKKEKKIEKSHEAKYGYIYNKEKDEFIDEVLCIPMLKPHSYTAEDVVEVQCHGGPIVLKKILELIKKKGARLAEPGEFTKRAFLNGRIDLSKAESVSDIIMSKNDYALRVSFEQLKGNLSNKINEFRKEILEAIAYIEACLDDPEHMSLEGYKDKLRKRIDNIKVELEKIIKNYDNGRIIKEGINTIIVGKPNVGKSSMLNLLLDEERAIVTDIAGTTRDIIKESVNLNGITLNIIDTAGIREDKGIDKVEEIGIERAKKEMEKADLILLVVDASSSIDNNDEKLFKLCKEQNKKYIIIINKKDLVKDKNDLKKRLDEKGLNEKSVKIIEFSTKTKEGLEELKESIEKMYVLGEIDFNREIFISNERQLANIEKAKEALQNVLIAIDKNVSEDFLTIDLNDAYTNLSQVLGIEINDDVVNEIFLKFCMGK